MSDDRSPNVSAWSFEGHRRRQMLRGLELTPAERLRWLEQTMEEMRSLLGRARGSRDMDPSTGRGGGREPAG